MSQGSIWLRSERCPECAKHNRDQHGDNFAVFSDGHKWCFSCGYREGSDSISNKEIERRLQLQQQQKQGLDNYHAAIDLPLDSTRTLPSVALNWLKKYGLTEKEIYNENSFTWSDNFSSLTYSVFNDDGEVIFYQRRYLGDSPYIPKYCNKGSPEDLFYIVGKHRTNITVVEDILSCIKVGRYTACLCLWGSELSQRRITRLSSMYKNLNIWLDKDKEMYSVMGRQRAAPFFTEARCIISEFDPKCYNNNEIIQFLGED